MKLIDLIKREEVRDRALKEWSYYGTRHRVYVSYLLSKETVFDNNPGNSAVLYALGITDVFDPNKDFAFRRGSAPDLDLDFGKKRRDDIIEYVIAKYSEDYTARIGTTNRYKPKAAIRGACRALGLSPPEADRYSGLIPKEKQGGAGANKVTLDYCLKPEGEFAEIYEPQLRRFAKAYSTDERFREIYEIALEIENLPQSWGVHAAGVVIGERPLTETVPVVVSSKEDEAAGERVPITGWEMNPVEAASLIKFDFLGLRTLDVIYDAIVNIERRTGIKIDFENEIEDGDFDTYDMLSEGDTYAVFQLESDGMSKFCKEYRPSSIEDLSAINALYRPGPLANGMVDEIIRVRNGERKTKYPISEVNEILRPTEGVLCYQEQVLSIAKDVCGFTLADADLMRRAIGKKKASAMAAEREKFLAGGLARGYQEADLLRLWEMIEKFSSYAFNKSHSVAYSFLSYQTAYLKCHFPSDFFAAELSSHKSNEKIPGLITDITKRGCLVLPPDVNESQFEFSSIDERTIRFGLKSVKGVGGAVLHHLVATRSKDGPFKDLLDFLRRVPKANAGVVKALALSGALDSLEPKLNRMEICEYAVNAAPALKKERDALSRGQTDMFGTFAETGTDTFVINIPKIKMDKLEMMELEKEYLSMYVSAHPLDAYSQIEHSGAYTPISHLTEPYETVNILGTIKDLMIRNTAKGQFAFFDLEGRDGTIKCKVWSHEFKKCGCYLEDGNVVSIRGKTNEYNGLEISVSRLVLAPIDRPYKTIYIWTITPAILKLLASRSGGQTEVILRTGHMPALNLGKYDLSIEDISTIDDQEKFQDD